MAPFSAPANLLTSPTDKPNLDENAIQQQLSKMAAERKSSASAERERDKEYFPEDGTASFQSSLDAMPAVMSSVELLLCAGGPEGMVAAAVASLVYGIYSASVQQLAHTKITEATAKMIAEITKKESEALTIRHAAVSIQEFQEKIKNRADWAPETKQAYDALKLDAYSDAVDANGYLRRDFDDVLLQWTWFDDQTEMLLVLLLQCMYDCLATKGTIHRHMALVYRRNGREYRDQYNEQLAKLAATHSLGRAVFDALKTKINTTVNAMREERKKHVSTEYNTGVDSSGGVPGYGTSVSYYKSEGKTVDKACPAKKGLKAQDHPREYISVRNEKTFWSHKYNEREMTQQAEEYTKNWKKGLEAHVQRYPRLLLDAIKLHEEAFNQIKKSFEPRTPMVPPILHKLIPGKRYGASGLPEGTKLRYHFKIFYEGQESAASPSTKDDPKDDPAIGDVEVTDHEHEHQWIIGDGWSPFETERHIYMQIRLKNADHWSSATKVATIKGSGLLLWPPEESKPM